MGKRIRINGKLYESVGRSMNESSGDREVSLGFADVAAKSLRSGGYSVVVYGANYDRGVEVAKVDSLDEFNDVVEEIKSLADDYKDACVRNLRRMSSSKVMEYDPEDPYIANEVFGNPVDFIKKNL